MQPQLLYVLEMGGKSDLTGKKLLPDRTYICESLDLAKQHAQDYPHVHFFIHFVKIDVEDGTVIEDRGVVAEIKPKSEGEIKRD